MQIGTVVWD